MAGKLSYENLEKQVDHLESRLARYETTLKNNETELEKYRLISEATSDYIYSAVVSSKGEIEVQWATHAFTRITGYTVDQVNALEDTWNAVVLKDDIHKITDGTLTMQNNDEPIVSEYRIVTKQGDIRWLRDRVIRVIYSETIGHLEILGGVRDITEQINAETAMQELYQEIKIREYIAHTFLTAPEDDLFSNILSLLLQEFDCRFGYTGYIDEFDNLVCPSMTRDIWSQCRIPEKSNVFPRSSWTGIWGNSLKSKQAMYSNGKLKVPNGHLPIHNILVAPMVLDQEVVGQFALANKSSEFTKKDMKKLERIAEFTAPVLKIYREKESAQQKQIVQLKKLKDQNIALNVLIENRNEEKQQQGDLVLYNFERLVLPYFEKIKAGLKREEIETFISIIERNIGEGLAPLEFSRPVVYKKFTPMEIQVADLIKSNKTSKEISQILNISLRSVFFHRANIRKKLHIQNSRHNLKSYLMQHS